MKSGSRPPARNLRDLFAPTPPRSPAPSRWAQTATLHHGPCAQPPPPPAPAHRADAPRDALWIHTDALWTIPCQLPEHGPSPTLRRKTCRSPQASFNFASQASAASKEANGFGSTHTHTFVSPMAYDAALFQTASALSEHEPQNQQFEAKSKDTPGCHFAELVGLRPNTLM